MALFKAYDIRGVVPDELDASKAYEIGRACAFFIARLDIAPAETGSTAGSGKLRRAIAVGRDARSHSPELTAALIDGLRDEGMDVLDLGLVATPMLYFAVERLRACAGVMVTASHNPGKYNGFKICREHAIPIGEASGLKEIEALLPVRAEADKATSRGEVEAHDILEAYAQHALSVGEDRPRLKVALDCGNGMASVGLEPVLEALGVETIRLYFEPDGRFPNHEADPLKVENLADVAEATRSEGADFGVAFDGDGDRAVFVDEKGRPVSADLATALIARHILRRNPGARVLYDLRSSRVVAEEIEAAGGDAGMCRVGHSFVKAQMREENAIFAGELSGHLYFRFSENLVADDGTAALVAMLDVLGREGKPMSELIDPLRRYAASGEINRGVVDPQFVMDSVEAEHAEAPMISHLDGLLVRYPTWWFNIRASNTEPVLRLNLEADTREEMVERRDAMLARIEELRSGGKAE